MDNFERQLSHIPSEQGNYILSFQLKERIVIKIGSLGSQHFPPGMYVYAGSALGPGGIRARVKHHLKPSPSPHWHMDYLKSHIEWQTIGWKVTQQRLECEWTKLLLNTGATAIVPGFGASDCRQKCPAHLLQLNMMPQNILDTLQIRDFLEF